MKLMFFGKLSDIGQSGPIEMPAHVETVAGLIIWLGTNNIELGIALNTKGVRAAVNQCMAENTARITNADEVAFFSPLSGG